MNYNASTLFHTDTELIASTVYTINGKLGESYIPWDETDLLGRARDNLNFIVRHLDNVISGVKGSSVNLTPEVAECLRNFIAIYCEDLLSPFTGDTGIPMSTFSSEYWDSGQSQIVDLHSSFSKSYVKDLEHLSGIYSFNCEGKLACGSNLDFAGRLAFHYHNIRGEHLASRPLYAEIIETGIDHFKWSPIFTFDNFYHLFTQQYPELNDVQGCKQILDLFGQFKARSLEQAVKSAVDLELNGKGPITFTTTWSEADFDATDGSSKPFCAISEDGSNIINYSSINQGSQGLGISRKTISTVMNYYEHYTSCPLQNDGMYTLLEQDKPSYSGNPYGHLKPRGRPSLPNINYDILPNNLILGIDKEYVVKYIWQTTGLAAAACGLGSYVNVSRWVNNRWIPVVVDNTKQVIAFIRNPTGLGSNKKTVVVTDTINNSTLSFTSLADCLRYFNVDVGTSSQWMKRYVRGDALYHNRYRIQYIISKQQRVNVGDKVKL